MVAAFRSRSSFPLVDLGVGVAAAEVGVVVAGVGEGEAAVVVEVLVDSAVAADSGAVVAGRAGDENSEP